MEAEDTTNSSGQWLEKPIGDCRRLIANDNVTITYQKFIKYGDKTEAILKFQGQDQKLALDLLLLLTLPHVRSTR